jgi:ADP-ribose pyrophosphatase
MSNSAQRFAEKTLTTTTHYRGRVIQLDVETVELPDGNHATRELVRHNGAVCVIALVDDQLLVVEQYRKALGKSIIEIPAGKLDGKHEDPLAAAQRELREETGFTARTWTKLYSFYSAPGFCDELIHIYLADQLEAGEAQPDEDEFLHVSRMSYEEAVRAIQTEHIHDAKTIMAIQAWTQFRQTGNFQLPTHA